MTDTRQVLEEAWRIIHPIDVTPDCVWPTECRKCDRFRRFLDAEAWTDAALMLIGEDLPWGIMKNPKSKQIEAGVSAKPNGDGVYAVVAETPALALAQAALRAQEAGDV